MAPVLPYSNKDTKYDNAKFRRRTRLRRFVQAIRNSNVKKQCGSCGIGQLLLLLLITGLMYLAVTHSKHSAASHGKKVGKRFEGTETLSQLWNRKGAPKVSSPREEAL